MTSLIDGAGQSVSGASPDALLAFEAACHDFRCLAGDPVGHLERALALAPEMPLAHLLKGWLYALSTEPHGMAVGAQCAAAAARLIDTAGRSGRPLADEGRERQHAVALTLLAGGRWRDAARELAALSRRWPHDALALQAGHQIDFFIGDIGSLRDRIAAALPAWDRDLPGYHALLGMHAFGLEECGDHDAAERAGREAIALQARDSWAWHAVAHTFEMRDRADDGIAWLEPNVDTWATQGLLATHLHWHLALFHLERDEHDAVLLAWDRFIGGTDSTLALNLVDAASMLWRLHLRGVEVGDRWESVADRWSPFADAGNYAFNDLHAMLAFVRAGRPAARDTVLATQAVAAGSDADNGIFTREVGSPATEAIVAFEAGRYQEAVRLLLPLRDTSHRFGGSHAQRDLLELTLLEAAIRAGDAALARELACTRLAWRASSRNAMRLHRRSMQLRG